MTTAASNSARAGGDAGRTSQHEARIAKQELKNLVLEVLLIWRQRLLAYETELDPSKHFRHAITSSSITTGAAYRDSLAQLPSSAAQQPGITAALQQYLQLAGGSPEFGEVSTSVLKHMQPQQRLFEALIPDVNTQAFANPAAAVAVPPAGAGAGVVSGAAPAAPDSASLTANVAGALGGRFGQFVT